MKGLNNNEEAIRILDNLKNRIHEIYKQGYKEGYKDGINDSMQKIAESILGEVQ